MSTVEKKVTDSYNISSGFGCLSKLVSPVLIVGGLTAIIAYSGSHSHDKRFWFAYLMVFMFWTAISLGALAFVIIHYLVRAHWSVLVRRIAENLSLNFVCVAVFAMPIFFCGGMDALYGHWLHSEHHVHVVEEHYDTVLKNPGVALNSKAHDLLVKSQLAYQAQKKYDALDYLKKAEIAGWKSQLFEAPADAHGHEGNSVAVKQSLTDFVAQTDAILIKKLPFLTEKFFIARGIAYLLIWIVIAFFYSYHSSRQDKDGKLHHTRWMNRMAPPCVFLGMLTLSFAAFDWIMSVESHWFSTMFGVYFFAGSFLSCFALMYMVVFVLRKLGMLKNTVTTEHDHDLGKWMFGFTIFWAYIAYSQFMLIGYANIPEETFWYDHRWSFGSGQWKCVSIALVLLKFVFPFLALLSRHVKRNATALFLIAAWILLMHLVDVYWMVMPAAAEAGWSVLPGATELICLVGMSSVFIGFFLFNTGRKALVPLKDPWFNESLNFENH